jgi:hypothetical protein
MTRVEDVKWLELTETHPSDRQYLAPFVLPGDKRPPYLCSRKYVTMNVALCSALGTATLTCGETDLSYKYQNYISSVVT